MNRDDQQRAWRLLDTQRGREPMSVPLLVRTAREHDIDLTPKEIWELGARLDEGGGAGLCPPLVSDFIVALLGGCHVADLLDPWMGLGTLLRPVVESIQPSRFVGIHPNQTALETARLVLPEGDNGEYRLGGCDGAALAHAEEFDAVVSVPPFGLKRPPFTINERELRDDGGNELLLRAALRLRPTGIAMVVVPPSFFFARRANGVAANLSHFGLFVDAAFLLPGGTFRPLTNIESYLIVVRRGEAPDSMFVAEAATSTANEVLANYGKRKAAKEPELGALVPRDEFTGLRQLVSARTLERQTKRLKLPARRLGDICAAIVRCPRTRDEIPTVDNSFFLPLAGAAKCRFEAGSLPKNPGQWAHVHVDPQLAEARVVAGYLDGPLGRLVIESHGAGSMVPTLRLSAVSELPVWLPNLEQQRSIIEVDQRLRSLSEELDGLRSQLWRRLDTADDVATNLQRVNNEDTFPLWLDTLPFPLASILWTYHSLKDAPLKRYNQLDFFFEGLAQFLAVLVVSAVRQDDSAFPEAWKKVQKTLSQGHMTLRRATLGTWVAVYEALAKLVRSDLSDADAAKHWLRLFACDDLDLLSGLVNKKMVALLKQANRLRNGWRGHGGIVGDTEAHHRELQYYELLLDFRGLVENRWEMYPLVLPRSGRYSQGLHHYSVESVVGTRTPFDGVSMILKQPMEDGQLHMAAPRLGATCPLLPLVRLGASPADKMNACYFFNRVEAEGLKYVSYHFEDQPEITRTFENAQAVLQELSADD